MWFKPYRLAGDLPPAVPRLLLCASPLMQDGTASFRLSPPFFFSIFFPFPTSLSSLVVDSWVVLSIPSSPFSFFQFCSNSSLLCWKWHVAIGRRANEQRRLVHCSKLWKHKENSEMWFVLWDECPPLRGTRTESIDEQVNSESIKQVNLRFKYVWGYQIVIWSSWIQLDASPTSLWLCGWKRIIQHLSAVLVLGVFDRRKELAGMIFPPHLCPMFISHDIYSLEETKVIRAESNNTMQFHFSFSW